MAHSTASVEENCPGGLGKNCLQSTASSLESSRASLSARLLLGQSIRVDLVLVLDFVQISLVRSGAMHTANHVRLESSFNISDLDR